MPKIALIQQMLTRYREGV